MGHRADSPPDFMAKPKRSPFLLPPDIDEWTPNPPTRAVCSVVCALDLNHEVFALDGDVKVAGSLSG